MRAGSSECQVTVAQSTSHTTARPPGRSARWISASAPVASATYSSTCTHSAASKLASATGSAVASPWWKAALAWRAQRRGGGGEHLGAGVDAHDAAVRPDDVEQLLGVEARPAADVEDPLAGASGEGRADERAPAAYVTRAVRRLELPDEVLVEDQLAHLRRPYLPVTGRPLTRCGNRSPRCALGAA